MSTHCCCSTNPPPPPTPHLVHSRVQSNHGGIHSTQSCHTGPAGTCLHSDMPGCLHTYVGTRRNTQAVTGNEHNRKELEKQAKRNQSDKCHANPSAIQCCTHTLVTLSIIRSENFVHNNDVSRRYCTMDDSQLYEQQLGPLKGYSHTQLSLTQDPPL